MTEEQKYIVAANHDGYELRSYQPCVIAEVEISAKFESAASQAFRYLFNYISGSNESSGKIAMTAPVLQIESSTETFTSAEPADIDANTQLVSFVMPSHMNLANTPLPTDPRIKIRELPAELVAVLRFSGRWSKQSYERQLRGLRSKIISDGYQEIDSPRFARFDAPWTPWFLRRNEIQIPVALETK